MKSVGIWKICDKSMKKSKISMEAHNNGLGHCSDVKELEDLCPLQVTLVSQVIPFMFIGKMKGGQHED